MVMITGDDNDDDDQALGRTSDTVPEVMQDDKISICGGYLHTELTVSRETKDWRLY